MTKPKKPAAAKAPPAPTSALPHCRDGRSYIETRAPVAKIKGIPLGPVPTPPGSRLKGGGKKHGA